MAGLVTEKADEKLGVAFSGGGIRSAAFCSGVLRWLTDQNKEPDYLSCVSGGGYTGSAYVQWKYFKGDDPLERTDEFFDHMRENTGHICNWQKSKCDGCLDFLVLIGVFFAIVAPVVGWLLFAFPIALVINLLYGQLFDGKQCTGNADSTDCTERALFFFVSFVLFIIVHVLEHCCKNTKKYLTSKTPKATFKLVQLISGSTFAFTFFPWFINDFLQFASIHVQIGIILVSAGFWFFVPILRGYSSLVLLIYPYSYIIYWRVYKGFFLVQYTDERFRDVMIASLVIMGVYSVLGELPQRVLYIYHRYRLHTAFYVEKESQCDKCQCDNCDWYDCFPGCYCCRCRYCCCVCPPEKITVTNDNCNDQASTSSGGANVRTTKINVNDRPLTLGDIHVKNLKEKKPLYISSMVVNNWRKDKERKYCLLTMSPEGISVIDKQPVIDGQPESDGQPVKDGQPVIDGQPVKDGQPPGNESENTEKLSSSDIKLSSAMAMSAAAVSPYFGRHAELERQTTHILTLLGFEMGANVVYDMESERNRDGWKLFCQYFINLIIAAAFIVLGALIGIGKLEIPSRDQACPIIKVALVMSFGVVLGLVAASAACCVCKLPCWLDQLLRWCSVHVPVWRFIESLLHVITYGEDPPAMMHLSDGGHFENYGLLPLLKRRLTKIILVHGLETKSSDDFAKDIIMAMELARDILGCSFTSTEGNDVLTDIKMKFGKNKSRTYEFKVHYPANGNNNRTGRILLLAPCRPKNNESDAQKTQRSRQDEEDTSRDIPMSNHQTWKIIRGRELNAQWNARWGKWPQLTPKDLEPIEGCFRGIGCCECCHKCYESRCCPWHPCIKFPRHPTLCQFFTPSIFTAYHREGYSVCMEKECEEFLGIDKPRQ